MEAHPKRQTEKEMIMNETECFADMVQDTTRQWVDVHKDIPERVIMDIVLNGKINEMVACYIRTLSYVSGNNITKAELIEQITDHVIKVVMHQVDNKPSKINSPDGDEEVN
jgi:hypothetical protein